DAPGPGVAALPGRLVPARPPGQLPAALSRLMGSAARVRSAGLTALRAPPRPVPLLGPPHQLCRELIAVTWQR
ncbi:hypothetical protein, partial [Streptacidiphilus pinicola]|uniref:hypothetical protein n=1 Tax=Streptacidiphilus pinicola TaxID=2219663 RepID=UPI001A9E25C9